jgi:hypothetical protein
MGVATVVMGQGVGLVLHDHHGYLLTGGGGDDGGAQLSWGSVDSVGGGPW